MTFEASAAIPHTDDCEQLLILTILRDPLFLLPRLASPCPWRIGQTLLLLSLRSLFRLPLPPFSTTCLSSKLPHGLLRFRRLLFPNDDRVPHSLSVLGLLHYDILCRKGRSPMIRKQPHPEPFVEDYLKSFTLSSRDLAIPSSQFQNYMSI